MLSTIQSNFRVPASSFAFLAFGLNDGTAGALIPYVQFSSMSKADKRYNPIIILAMLLYHLSS